MTEFLFIRHGEPDYTEIDKRIYKGFGNELAPLTKNGIEQVKNINMLVELDLMEWIPDLSYSYDDYSDVVKWREIYEKNNGKHTNKLDNWEEKESIKKRVRNVLKKYLNYSKVIIVTHGMVINTLTNVEKPEYAKIIKYSYTS